MIATRTEAPTLAAISQTTILVGEVAVLVSFPEGCEEVSVLQGAVGV